MAVHAGPYSYTLHNPAYKSRFQRIFEIFDESPPFLNNTQSLRDALSLSAFVPANSVRVSQDFFEILRETEPRFSYYKELSLHEFRGLFEVFIQNIGLFASNEAPIQVRSSQNIRV